MHRRVALVTAGAVAAIVLSCSANGEDAAADACDAYLDALFGTTRKPSVYAIDAATRSRFRAHCSARAAELGLDAETLLDCAYHVTVRSGTPTFGPLHCGSECNGGGVEGELCDIGYCKTRRFVTEGSACVGSATCKRGLECNTARVPVCERWAGAGEVCNRVDDVGPRVYCLSNLECIDKRCRVRKQPGEPCIDGAPNDCVFGASCENGACSVHPPSRNGEMCFLESRVGVCESSTACDGTTCKPRIPDGEACGNATRRFCRQFSICQQGKCTPFEQACRVQ